MKKIFTLLFAVCTMLLPLGLTACGSTYAKITGIGAGIGTEQIHPLVHENPLENDLTIAKNDYILQVDTNYLLCVAYVQSGGSIVRDMSDENVSLTYDEDVLEIAYSHNDGIEALYNLTCKKEVAYTAVIIEVENKYSYTVIISAK